MSLPESASHEDWLAARKELLLREKELTRLNDALNADRRRLPMVRIDKDYTFTGPRGETGLLDLFEGRRQLIVQHFMFDPSWEDGCPGCTASVDEIADGCARASACPRDHLRARLPGSLREARGLPGAPRLDRPLVLVAWRATSTTTSMSPSTSRSHRF